jgi:WD40 repeat protein
MRGTWATVCAALAAGFLLTGCPLEGGPGPGPAPAPAGGQVRLVDLAKGAQTQAVPLAAARVMDLAVSPDGRRVAVAGPDGTALLYDLTGQTVGQAARRWATKAGALTAVTFSGDGRLLVAANAGGRVFCFDVASGKAVRDVQGHDTAVTALAAVDAAGRVASADQDGVLKLWDVTDGKLLNTWRAVEGGAVRALAASPSAAVLATAGVDGKLRLWGADGKLKVVVPAAKPAAAVTALGLSASGKVLAAGTADGRILLMDATQYALQQAEIRCAKHAIVSVVMVGEDRVLAACETGCLKRFTAAGEAAGVLPKGAGTSAMAVTGDGKTAIVGR